VRGKIAEQFEDEDGHWIVLNAGWRMPGDAHTICERTKAEARAKLKDAIRCECAECKQIKTEAKSN
jgi:hypothetical protein